MIILSNPGLITILLVLFAAESWQNKLFAGDTEFLENSPHDVISVNAKSGCNLISIEACTYSKYQTLCSMTMYFSDCPPLHAASTKCDVTSRYFKTKGKCSQSGYLQGKITAIEPFVDGGNYYVDTCLSLKSRIKGCKYKTKADSAA